MKKILLTAMLALCTLTANANNNTLNNVETGGFVLQKSAKPTIGDVNIKTVGDCHWNCNVQYRSCLQGSDPYGVSVDKCRLNLYFCVNRCDGGAGGLNN